MDVGLGFVDGISDLVESFLLLFLDPLTLTAYKVMLTPSDRGGRMPWCRLHTAVWILLPGWQAAV